MKTMRIDPGGERAMGSANREWIRMKKLALRLRGNCDPEWAERIRPRFTGIYKRLLTDPEEELRAS